MKICAISMQIGPAFKEMGHEVVNFWPQENIFDLRAALAERSFIPDLIFQKETLGPRVILKGLQDFPCPKIFWSLDTHLNIFWQTYYCRLFDGVLTPHLSIFQKGLRPLHSAMGRLAIYGIERPWRPFAERLHDVAFVGRITEYRPLRKWLAEFLEKNYKATVVQEIPFAEMLDLYGESRLAPNESLLSEVNFRLLEAASCGCLVLSQDVGPDQNVLFGPGREIETYTHVLELKALLGHHLARLEQAERMARAAWERVQKEHLLRHRCQSVLDFGVRLSPAAALGHNAETAYWLTLRHLHRAGMLVSSSEDIIKALTLLVPTPEVLAALILVLTEGSQKDAALGVISRILSEGMHPNDFELNLAGSMAGIFLDDWNVSKQFWYRYTAQNGSGSSSKPESPAHLCLLWARELSSANLLGSSGFQYDPTAHVPKDAVECLYLAQRLAPDDLEITRRLDALLSRLPGREYMRLGHLSHLALHTPKNWRTGLLLGLMNLKAFRMQQGLEEVLLAMGNAVRQGKKDSFLRTLSALDPKGYVLAALKEWGTSS